ncbi:unnamed protein product [Durusdinium trenchii]
MSVHFQAKSREDSEFEFHQTPLDFGWIQSGRGWMKKKEKGVDQAMSQSPTLHGTRSIDAECSPLKADEYAKEGKDGLCCALVCRVAAGHVLYNDEVTPDAEKLQESCISGKFHSILGDREKCRGTFKEF